MCVLGGFCTRFVQCSAVDEMSSFVHMMEGWIVWRRTPSVFLKGLVMGMRVKKKKKKGVAVSYCP